MENRITEMEADNAFPGRTTNSAFVFVKPAAVTPATLKLVEEKFRSFGIKITGSGSLDAKTIDKKMLIDNHYGAIASKAMKLKPSELNVSEKAQAEFKDVFGLDWAEAVAGTFRKINVPAGETKHATITYSFLGCFNRSWQGLQCRGRLR